MTEESVSHLSVWFHDGVDAEFEEALVGTRYNTAGVLVELVRGGPSIGAWQAELLTYDAADSSSLAKAERRIQAERRRNESSALIIVAITTKRDRFDRDQINRAILEVAPRLHATHFVLDRAQGEDVRAWVGREISRVVRAGLALSIREDAASWLNAVPESPQAQRLAQTVSAQHATLTFVHSFVWKTLRPVVVFTNSIMVERWLDDTALPSSLARRGLFVLPFVEDWNELSYTTQHFMNKARRRGQVFVAGSDREPMYRAVSAWLSGRYAVDERSTSRRLLFAGLKTDPQDWPDDMEVRFELTTQAFSVRVLDKLLKNPDPKEPSLVVLRPQVLHEGAGAGTDVMTRSAQRIGVAQRSVLLRFVGTLRTLGYDRRMLLASAAHFRALAAMFRPLIPRDNILRLAAPYNYGQLAGLGAGSFGCVVSTRPGRGHPGYRRGATERIAVKVERLREPAFEAQVIGVLSRFATDVARMTPFAPEVLRSYVLRPLTDRDRVASRAFTSLVEDACARFQSRAALAGRGSLDPSRNPFGTLVMEMPVYENSLGTAMRSTILTNEERILWMLQLTHSSVALHEAVGFVHNDIKPSNILVRTWTPRRSVVILLVRSASGHVLTLRVEGATLAAFADVGESTAEAIPDLTSSQRGRLTERRMWGWFGGTEVFQSPDLFTFIDPSEYRSGERRGWLATPGGTRGVAADLWALGVTFASMWTRALFQSTGFSSDPLEPRILVASGMATAVTRALRIIAGEVEQDVFGDPAKLGFSQKIVHKWATTQISRSFSHTELFLRQYALAWAFAGEPPKQSGAGPFFVATAARQDQIRAALTHWKEGGTRTPFELLANRMRNTVPEVFDFVAHCFVWDPVERARFFTSGDVFAHPVFAQFVVTDRQAAQDAQPGNTYMLDLLPERERVR